MTAAHGGFGSERVPLGGGAAVFERLCKAWSQIRHLELQTAGAGPLAPPATAYRQLATPAQEPSKLGTIAYARFCREFEQATTELALEQRPDLVLAHDISEGPDVLALQKAGIPVATIFHVDVVDIFSRLYLASVVKPERLTRGYRHYSWLPWPNILKLVFEKQENVMRFGVKNVVPSLGAAHLLTRCYPEAASITEVIGWGAPQLSFEKTSIEKHARRLRLEAGIPEHHKVLLTLSRLSPEKAQHRLLEALLLAESEGRVPQDVTVVIAGAPAFMQGEQHARRLRKLAKKLRTKVHFAGHVGGLDKAGWYKAGDIFVVCSLHESYGLTTLEAMQQGCPVVAVSSFGTEATVSAESGRLVLPGAELLRRLWGELELLLTPEGESERALLAQGASKRAKALSFSSAAEQLLQSLLIDSSPPKESLGP